MAKNTRNDGEVNDNVGIIGTTDGVDIGNVESTAGDGESGDNDAANRPSDGGSGDGDPTTGIDPTPKPAGRSGRRSGGSAGTSQKTAKTLLKDSGNKALAYQIVGAHKIVGTLTGHPQVCEISEREAEALVQAVTDLLAQYKIKPNPKVTAWLNFAGIAGVIYGPRLLMLREMSKQNKKQPPSQPAADVVAPAPVGGLQFG